MIEADSNHYQVLEKSLSGKRAVDEQTFVSLAILSERLERLKKLDAMFGDIVFSPAVEELKKRKNAVAVV